MSHFHTFSCTLFPSVLTSSVRDIFRILCSKSTLRQCEAQFLQTAFAIVCGILLTSRSFSKSQGQCCVPVFFPAVDLTERFPNPSDKSAGSWSTRRYCCCSTRLTISLARMNGFLASGAVSTTATSTKYIKMILLKS